MRVSSEFDHVTSKGSIYDGMSRVDYYTTSPSPTQWVAVGVVFRYGIEEKRRRPQRMLVGKGHDEAGAVTDLRRRFASLCGHPHPVEARQPAAVGSPAGRHGQPAPSILDPLAPDAEAASETEPPSV